MIVLQFESYCRLCLLLFVLRQIHNILFKRLRCMELCIRYTTDKILYIYIYKYKYEYEDTIKQKKRKPSGYIYILIIRNLNV